VDAVGDQFLSGSALSEDHNRGIGRGDLQELRKDLPHSPALAHDPRKEFSRLDLPEDVGHLIEDFRHFLQTVPLQRRLLFIGAGAREERQALRPPHKFHDGIHDQPQDHKAAHETESADECAPFQNGPDRIRLALIAGEPIGDDNGDDRNAGIDERDQDIEVDVNSFPVPEFLHQRTILVRSHMGRKIAMAKNPTTAARPTIRAGPRASDSLLTAYPTSSS